MEDSKHTPGPWHVVKCDGGFRGFDADDWTVIAQNKIVPALVWGGVAFEEGKANARLIAAAPELLDALQKIMRLVDAGQAKSLEVADSNASHLARSAIAKATGGA